MRILLLGGSGMLGSDCKVRLEKVHEVVAPTSKEVDIISWDVVIETIETISPEVIVNCAAFTDVDACETEEFKVRKVNVEGPRNLAQGSARFRVKLIHISSDYVFDGRKPMPQPYFEDDPLNPLSAYGKSKAESEVALRENSPNYAIIRTAWLYGVNGKNFIRSILSRAVQKETEALQVADDQFGSPTWTYRLAEQIGVIIDKGGKGTYHATAEGYCSRFEFASHVIEKLGLKVPVEPCKMKAYPMKARRPANCVLENRRLKKQGIHVMRDWKEDLDSFLDQYGDRLLKEARTRKT